MFQHATFNGVKTSKHQGLFPSTVCLMGKLSLLSPNHHKKIDSKRRKVLQMNIEQKLIEALHRSGEFHTLT
jgi:hypothetical protein